MEKKDIKNFILASRTFTFQTKKEMQAMDINGIFFLLSEINYLCNSQIVTANRLAEHFQITPSAIVQFLNIAQQKGYIIRIPSQQDRRILEIQISLEGYQFLKENEEKLMSRINSLVEEIGENDFMTLLRIYQKINNILMK